MAEDTRRPPLIFLIFIFLIGTLVRLGESLPISPRLVALERIPGSPDHLRPSLCPSKCLQDFGALPLSSPAGDHSCACICPPDAPIFLTTDGRCVPSIAECFHPIHFSSGDSISGLGIPTIRLPISGGQVNPRDDLLWKDSNLDPLDNNCTLKGVYVDSIEHPWRPASNALFSLVRGRESIQLKWTGTDEEGQMLEGTAVQLQLDCPNREACIPFRVAGRSEVHPVRAVITGSSPRSNLTVIIVLSTLLALSIIGSAVVWNVCWRMKKERLVHEIQMQFLVHFRQQHDEAIKAASMIGQGQAFGQQMAHQSTRILSQSEFSPNQPPQMQQVPAQKRKLYFSTDFFDPNLMINPPPMAEQFLYDLRRMIDVAKERIRLKRHVPQLPGIVEEEEMSPRDGPVLHKITPEVQMDEEKEAQQDSPRSGKSVDSGHESPEASSDGSGDEERRDKERPSEQKDIKDPSQDHPPTAEGQVRRLVHGFEAVNSPTIPPKPVVHQQSRIPTLSPKTPRAQGLTPFGSPIPPSPGGQNAYRKTKNKGYTVFPVDPMLKKSLPRRPKRDFGSQQKARDSEKN